MSDDWRDHKDDPKSAVMMTDWGKDQLAQLYGWALRQGYDPANEYIESADDGDRPPWQGEDGQLSEHFKLSEFACRCGCVIPDDKHPPQGLIDKLEEVRAHFGAPVVITSGYRCPSHNASVGGAIRSRHMEGDASDIKVSGVAPSKVYAYADATVANGGVGSYDTFTHIDVRGTKARW